LPVAQDARTHPKCCDSVTFVAGKILYCSL